jgi:perosamine synthetase
MRCFFTSLGGDGYYAAYQPVHREPIFPILSNLVKSDPERFPHWHGKMPDYNETSCPVWESIQPQIIMLKTKYFDLHCARRQAVFLAKTIKHFS